jgi:hypothetical protein
MLARHLASVLVVPLLLLAGLLGACGSSAADDASAKVCAARDDIAKEVDKLKGLTLTTATTDQVTTSLQAIKKDLTTIKKSRGELSDQRRQDVEAANSEFGAAIRQTAVTVGRSVSVDAAAADAEQALDQLATSYKTSFGKLDCS